MPANKTAIELLEALFEIEQLKDREQISNKAYAVVRRSALVEIEIFLNGLTSAQKAA